MTETPEVLVVGETLIDFIPSEPGPLAEIETFSRRAGGAAANVAIGLARLDSAPYFLTNVSADGFGDYLIDTLEANGVSGEFVTRDPIHETTLAFVSHDAAGDRSFTFHGTDTADGYLDSSVLGDDVLEDLSWVCINGPVALAAEGARNAIFDLCERAREHDCSIAFDPNTRRDLWENERLLFESLEEMLTLTDVCKASVEDFSGTPYADGTNTETGERSIASAVTAAGPHTVFLTGGPDGANVHVTGRAPWDAGSYTHPGFAVDAIDTTGAGDAFLAGVLRALVAEEDIETVLEFANAVAAIATTEAGAIAALPYREDVRALRSR